MYLTISTFKIGGFFGLKFGCLIYGLPILRLYKTFLLIIQNSKHLRHYESVAVALPNSKLEKETRKQIHSDAPLFFFFKVWPIGGLNRYYAISLNLSFLK